jgi:CRP-like cAMP-binding protein
LRNGRRAVIAINLAGDLVGSDALLHPRRDDIVVALAPVTYAALDRAQLRALADRPPVLLHLLQLASAEQRALTDWAARLVPGVPRSGSPRSSGASTSGAATGASAPAHRSTCRSATTISAIISG